MKKSIIYITALVCIIVGLFYVTSDELDSVEHKANERKLVTTLKNETSHTLASTKTKVGSVDEFSKNEIINSFEQLLAGMPQHDKEKYLKLNEQFFGALDFSDSKSYGVFLEQGFPSVDDIDYVDKYTRDDMSSMLFENAGENSSFEEDQSLNLHAISAVNLIRAIDELGVQIKYYFPDYKQGEPFPNINEWPESEYPGQVDEALKQLILSYATVREYTAIQYLAKARYEQLSFGFEKNESNIGTVLTKLAMADKKLAGNSNILNYVKQHYPNEVETYINLRKNL